MEITKDKKKRRSDAKEKPPNGIVTPIVFPKSFYDTENYWYYYTEIRKE